MIAILAWEVVVRQEILDLNMKDKGLQLALKSRLWTGGHVCAFKARFALKSRPA